MRECVHVMVRGCMHTCSHATRVVRFCAYVNAGVHACARVSVNRSVHMSLQACVCACVIVREAGGWVWELECGPGPL